MGELIQDGRDSVGLFYEISGDKLFIDALWFQLREDRLEMECGAQEENLINLYYRKLFKLY